MAYFKVEKSGCTERKGRVQVRYDLFFGEADAEYSRHYIQVPYMTGAEYAGKIDESGNPVDAEDYAKWVSSLPKKWINTPFCGHFCHFEPDVTDEEILYVGELALDMALKNYRKGSVLLNKNEPVTFTENETVVAQCEERVNDIIQTDFTAVPVESEVPYSVR